jgi:UDP-N-acetyl-D-glucosamine dehydrogenase
VAYKPAVGDIRESPSLKIIERLQSLGGEVVYHDAFVPELPKFGLANVPLDEALDGADIVLIVTAHPGIDHLAIAQQQPTVDYRGVTRTTRAAARPPMEMAVLPKRDIELEPTEVAA